MLTEAKKQCSKCGTVKRLSEFYRQVGTKDGRSSRCAECARQAAKESWKRRSTGPGFLRQQVERFNTWANENPRKYAFSRARASANKRGIQFSLLLEDIPEIPVRCPVFGFELSFYLGRGEKQRDSLASLDRIDNTLGYTKDNIVWVSHKVNRIKSRSSVEELILVAAFYSKYRKEMTCA